MIGILAAVVVVTALFMLVKGLSKMIFGLLIMIAAGVLVWWAMLGFPMLL